MDEIEKNKEEITENMNKLDKLINWSPLFTSDRKKWTDSCRALIKSTKDLIIALQEEVKELPIAQSSRHVGAVNSLKVLLLAHRKKCRS